MTWKEEQKPFIPGPRKPGVTFEQKSQNPEGVAKDLWVTSPAIASGPKGDMHVKSSLQFKGKKDSNLRKDAFVGTVSGMDGCIDGWLVCRCHHEF